MTHNKPNMDVVEFTRTPLLDEDALQELRRCENPEYVPDTNLFAIMYDDGPDWATARAGNLLASGSYTDEELHNRAVDMAKEMTIEIQDEYGVCLPDNRISQMFGMSHDFSRLALGLRIPAPEGNVQKKGVVMHRKRIREYFKDDQGAGK